MSVWEVAGGNKTRDYFTFSTHLDMVHVSLCVFCTGFQTHVVSNLKHDVLFFLVYIEPKLEMRLISMVYVDSNSGCAGNGVSDFSKLENVSIM